jgi:hypothetical protein
VTQHEYVFVAVSIILGLAITRLLHTVAMLIRAKARVSFHWSSAVYGLNVLAYTLQFWWVGWGLHDKQVWAFSDFLVLVFGSICIYGAAELAFPVPNEGELDMWQHNQGLGRLSALSLLAYFSVGPYVNISMYGNPILAALTLPAIGAALMGLMIFMPRWFKTLSVVFSLYTFVILYLTA